MSSVQDKQEDEEALIQPKCESPRRVISLPEEPTPDNEDSLELVLRMPSNGERVKRRFLKSDAIELVYDFIDHLQNEGKC